MKGIQNLPSCACQASKVLGCGYNMFKFTKEARLQEEFLVDTIDQGRSGDRS
jgi:hypothetical protein